MISPRLWCAATLKRLAARIDPAPMQIMAAASLDPAPGDQTAFAEKFCNDMILRDAMFRALNRYSPRRVTAQA